MFKISTHVHPHRICEQLYIFCIHYVTVICKIWFLFYVEKLKKNLMCFIAQLYIPEGTYYTM